MQPQVNIMDNNQNIKTQIKDLEQEQSRALREMILNPNEIARQKLQGLEATIENLRTQLA